MKKENSYKTDGVPGEGKRLSDGTWWTQVLPNSVKVGQKSQRAECIDVKRFGSHTYALWK